MNKIIVYLLLIVFTISTVACGKKFLDYKADQRQVVPKTLDEFQGLLDYFFTMNEQSSTNMGMIGGDEYYVTEAQYNSLLQSSVNDFQKNAYIWADVVYVGKEPTQVDWMAGYSRVMLANLCLNSLDDIKANADNQDKWNLLKGNALFFRSLAFYEMAQAYCPVYNAATASSDLGLPVRLDADPTVRVARSSVEATYAQMLSDLLEAEKLLPNTPLVIFRPGKAAANALLCRVYMQMGDYTKARESADRCLLINDKLTNFNTLSFTGSFTFPVNGTNNQEVLFMNSAYIFSINSSSATGTSLFNADSVLFKSYSPGDLRFNAYWGKSGVRNIFKGSYKGTAAPFTGFATDEVYLNRAECLAREKKTAAALADLNKLRQNRFTPATYVELESNDEQEVLDWVIAERRKELVCRGTRWDDLRRLNKEPRYATTLERQLGDKHYELKPGSLKWTWPLPVEALSNGGYQQNPR